MKPYLSVIIPAYNEEKNIKRTLLDLLSEVKSLDYKTEIIVVDDHSKDKTKEIANEVKDDSVKVFSLSKNRGKGYALTYGVNHASGDIITFFDAGGDFHPDHINRFIKLLEAFDADIVIGSKRHPASKVDYPFKRRFMSFIMQVLVWLLFHLKVRDTQAGLKVFKKSVLEKVLPRVLVKQYAFDLELLVIAKRMGFNRIFEAPVNMNFNTNNSGIKTQTIVRMLTDIAAIFYRRYIIHYYDKPHIHILEENPS